MRTLILFIVLIAISTACSKQPSVDVVGRWQIGQQLTAIYSGSDKTEEQIIELEDAYMQFNQDGLGSISYQQEEMIFSYVVSDDEIVLSTEFCKRSSWIIIEATGENLIIEHSNPSMVTVRYMKKLN
ncbi:MAG: hypothetical protein IH597_13430 [Bacteroidales bacterium]|nr:hypothetical protein [Bacteroidales bacterium]